MYTRAGRIWCLIFIPRLTRLYLYCARYMFNRFRPKCGWLFVTNIICNKNNDSTAIASSQAGRQATHHRFFYVPPPRFILTHYFTTILIFLPSRSIISILQVKHIFCEFIMYVDTHAHTPVHTYNCDI